jgi:hypothetical protein
VKSGRGQGSRSATVAAWLPPGLAVSGVVLVDHIGSVDRKAHKMEVVVRLLARYLRKLTRRVPPC